jgi:hypothetical protein
MPRVYWQKKSNRGRDYHCRVCGTTEAVTVVLRPTSAEDLGHLVMHRTRMPVHSTIWYAENGLSLVIGGELVAVADTSQAPARLLWSRPGDHVGSIQGFYEAWTAMVCNEVAYRLGDGALVP